MLDSLGCAEGAGLKHIPEAGIHPWKPNITPSIPKQLEAHDLWMLMCVGPTGLHHFASLGHFTFDSKPLTCFLRKPQPLRDPRTSGLAICRITRTGQAGPMQNWPS